MCLREEPGVELKNIIALCCHRSTLKIQPIRIIRSVFWNSATTPTETISHVNFQRSQHLSFPLFRMPGAGPGLRSMVREIGEGAPASEGESSSGNQLNLEPVKNSTQSQHAISKNSKSEFVEMLPSA